MGILVRAQSAGCIATGAALLGVFFLIGTAVSLFSGDLSTTLQAFVVGALLLGAALWLSRRRGA